MKIATLCFLVKKDDLGKVEKVCLAMKKKGFGVGMWNGVGGKVEEGETIEQAMIREVEEEIGVKIDQFENRGKIMFADDGENFFTFEVNVFVSDKWQGEPVETDEMSPKWFDVGDIPYDQMWVDDKYWLPQVIEGRGIQAEFYLSVGGKEILSSDIRFE
jgi:8-oxo-dGTP pyrophosphatase MutT (NUDIX family)